MAAKDAKARRRIARIAANSRWANTTDADRQGPLRQDTYDQARADGASRDQALEMGEEAIAEEAG